MSVERAPRPVFGKLRLSATLASVALVALSLFALVIHSEIRQYRTALLTDGVLASAEALRRPSPASHGNVFSRVGLTRDDSHTAWRPVSPDSVPPTLLDVLTEPSSESMPRSGVVGTGERTIVWALVAGADPRAGLLVFRTLDPGVAGIASVLGAPFAVAAFLMLWVMVWSGVTVGSLVERTHRQNHLLINRSEQLIEARDAAQRADRSKSVFLANMSHEIRTPMAGVLGITDLLRRCELSEQARAYADRIHTSARSLLDILNDILDHSKLDAAHVTLEPVDVEVRQMLQDSLAALETQALQLGLELHVAVAEGVPRWVRLDPVRLRQILINLVGNSVKFTETGSITVSVESESVDDRHVSLRLTVSDTGIGIPHEALGRIFDEFVQADLSTTRHYGGTGLGLAITRQLVDLMEGTIEVSSIPGEGSVFVVTVRAERIAASPPADSGAPSVERAPLPPIGSLSVLVAEDNAVNREMLADMLRLLGVEPRTVQDGAEAVEAYCAERFDLVLMDFWMPRMDGVEATREIRRLERLNGSDSPVSIVALTGTTTVEDRKACLDAGMNDVMYKPILLDQLETLIVRVDRSRKDQTVLA